MAASSQHEFLEAKKTKEQASRSAVWNLLCDEKKKTGTFQMKRSSLLSRVEKFIPVIEKANNELQTDINEGKGDLYNIEVLPDDAEEHIEMNLAMFPDDSDSCSDDEVSSDESSDSESESDQQDSQQLETNSNKKKPTIEVVK